MKYISKYSHDALNKIYKKIFIPSHYGFEYLSSTLYNRTLGSNLVNIKFLYSNSIGSIIYDFNKLNHEK